MHEEQTGTPGVPGERPLLSGASAPSPGAGVSPPHPADDDAEPVRRTTGPAESSRANRGWWDRNADEYQAEHGEFLGDDRFVWGPEGIDEEEVRLLGPAGSLAGREVLEVGAGAAQCSRWLAAQGARAVALDLAHRQLQHALRLAADGDVQLPGRFTETTSGAGAPVRNHR